MFSCFSSYKKEIFPIMDVINYRLKKSKDNSIWYKGKLDEKDIKELNKRGYAVEEHYGVSCNIISVIYKVSKN